MRDHNVQWNTKLKYLDGIGIGIAVFLGELHCGS
jgi:hypothetical protein